jgi:hypothetical protein
MKRRPVSVLMHRSEIINLKTAIERSGKSERTLRGWCSRFGLSRQSGPKAPLEISAPALEMVLGGDFEALELLRCGDRGHESVRRYFRHLGITPQSVTGCRRLQVRKGAETCDSHAKSQEKSMSDIAEKKAPRAREKSVPVALRGGKVMESFRDNLFDACNRTGVTPNEFCLLAAAEKLKRSGRHVSGVFWKGDLAELNGGMGI